MPFSEKTKKEVKERAAFKCCRCQTIGIDVHHIIQERDEGTDDISNAAPLCQNCHDQFGANPEKRKEITQMRDWWYGRCEKLYTNKLFDEAMLKKINEKLETIQKSQSGIPELKEMLKETSNKLIESITPETARITATGIINTSTATSATKLGDRVYANFQCSNCNTWIGLLIGSDKCPNCGAKIS